MLPLKPELKSACDTYLIDLGQRPEEPAPLLLLVEISTNYGFMPFLKIEGMGGAVLALMLCKPAER